MERKRLMIYPWDGRGLVHRPYKNSQDHIGLIWKSVKGRYKSSNSRAPEPGLYVWPECPTRIVNIGDIVLMWEDGEYVDNLQYMNEWDGL